VRSLIPLARQDDIDINIELPAKAAYVLNGSRFMPSFLRTALFGWRLILPTGAEYLVPN
jgi:hypothetical protein